MDSRRQDGRYVRWNWAANTFQVKTVRGEWRNISVHLARTYAAAGLPIGSHR